MLNVTLVAIWLTFLDQIAAAGKGDLDWECVMGEGNIILPHCS